MKGLLIILTLLTLYSCDTSKPTDTGQLTSKDSSVQNNNFTIGSDTIKNFMTLGTLFQNSIFFEVLEFKKSADYPSSMADTIICEEWALSRNDIQKIIKDSDPISGPDWHHLFEHLPCQVTGKLKQNQNTFDFAINSGSWLTIDCSDTILRFGSFKKENEHLFLSTAWNIENEK